MAKAWYAVRTKARREEQALGHFERQGFTAYLPRTMERRLRRGRVCAEVRPFFPGYLFLHLAEHERRWTTICSTVGAIGVVHFGMHYPAVPDTLIAALRRREDTDGLITVDDGGKDAVPFRQGERVRIVAGPMAGFEGIFQCARGEDRAVLLLSWLARGTRVEMPLDCLLSASD